MIEGSAIHSESGAATATAIDPASSIVVALAGNPNAGKTSLFNALTGLRQKVANYPGVTVERKEGSWQLSRELPPARLVDLPGLYSLEADAMDERIARDVLMGRASRMPRPDVIIAVVDATNLERNLYLVTQLLEYERPLVIALTMMDMAEKRKLGVNAEQLSAALGIPVVPVVATQKRGLDALAAAVLKAVNTSGPAVGWSLPEHGERELGNLFAQAGKGGRYAAIRELYSDELPPERERRAAIDSARQRLASVNAHWWQEPLLARYRWIERIAEGAVDFRSPEHRLTATEGIDRIVTHRVLGPFVLVVVMVLVFQAIFSWARLPMDLIDHGFGALAELLRAHMPAGLFTDLIADGVIAGVGAVLVFLPQIVLLFFFIAVLEDSGYMARAAFIMDRLMRGVGLHGKAFMPLLSSFACAIPGIMATRTIENPKDRLATIMIAPFMSCSARLPVYTLMIAAFFSNRKVFGFVSEGALIIMAMYLLGITVAVIVAWILKHTILKAPPPPLVLELPPYRVPNLVNVGHAIKFRSWLFVRRAGTIILAISILLWALASFPRANSTTAASLGNGSQPGVASFSSTRGLETDSADDTETVAKGEQVRNSFAGRLGRLIEPAVAPLGFDWKMGIGLISSFAARETLVSTLSIVYNAGSAPEKGKESPSLIDAIKNARKPDGSPSWTPLIAVSMMVFFVLACQCMSTVAIVRRETNSWRWPLFMVSYMLVIAYVASLITFQGGRLLGLG